ncbi:MAG: pyruvate, phosphate dikinase, partial [Clostridiales bacterium]|nr:pyruvate, phosphate dikinase [Clostridiales bacterium]
MEKKFVYMFAEGDASMKNLLGGKGANLAEMTNLGLPVPQGFIITTEACTDYYEQGQFVAEYIVDEVKEAMMKLEKLSGKKFGDPANPLLVSVRSGARASMPGMMDTILNLGLNDETVPGLAELTQNPRFAHDSYRRFIQMFSDVVMEIPKSEFDRVLERVKEKKGVQFDNELTTEDLQEIISSYQA